MKIFLFILIDIIALWIGLKGLKIFIYSLETGSLSKHEKGTENIGEEFAEDLLNGILLFFGTTLFFPLGIYLALGIICNLI